MPYIVESTYTNKSNLDCSSFAPVLNQDFHTQYRLFFSLSVQAILEFISRPLLEWCWCTAGETLKKKTTWSCKLTCGWFVLLLYLNYLSICNLSGFVEFKFTSYKINPEEFPSWASAQSYSYSPTYCKHRLLTLRIVHYLYKAKGGIVW